MKKHLVLGLLVCLVLSAFKKVSKCHFTVPEGWPKPKYNFNKKPLDPEKILLGRALFYDPILSRDSTVSCSSCHTQYAAFTHIDHSLSHGIDGRIGTRNSPALMNLAWQKEFMWDGRAAKIQIQAILPITHPDEMDETIEHVLLKLKHSNIYPNLFYASFGDSAINSEQMLEAISQFMVSIISSESMYDSVMRNQATFTPKEANGYKLFKQHCASCHTEPLFTNLAYENNGLPVDTSLKDYGRVNVTHKAIDSFKFKVPTLRNIEISSPYMHDGRFKRLHDVVNYYTSGIHAGTNLAPQLRDPIQLSANEKVDLVAFLLTLTDMKFLSNKEYSYPKKIFSDMRMIH